MGRDVLRESGVPARARREVREGANKGGYAGRLRPRLPESSGAIGSDSRDPDAIAEIGAGVDERLQQRPGPRDEDDDRGGGHVKQGYRAPRTSP